MSGPKRAPGHYRPKRRVNGQTVTVSPYVVLGWLGAAGLYVILKYEAHWQWMDRVAAALWSQIKPLFE